MSASRYFKVHSDDLDDLVTTSGQARLPSGEKEDEGASVIAVGQYHHLGMHLKWRKKRNGISHFEMPLINQIEVFDEMMLFYIPRLYISACSLILYSL